MVAVHRLSGIQGWEHRSSAHRGEPRLHLARLLALRAPPAQRVVRTGTSLSPHCRI